MREDGAPGPGDERTAGFLQMIDELNARHLIGVAGAQEVWLIRHADAYMGLAALADGPIDPPLSERGRRQAALLAARLAPVPLEAVWSSHLGRARQTAQAIAAGRSLEVRVDARLREVRTYWDEGLPSARPEPGQYPFPEPEAEVAARVRAAVMEVAAALDGAGSPRAAVVTHNAAIAIFLSSVLGLRWGQLHVMPQFTSVSVVTVKGDLVVVQSIADATHLAGLDA